MPTDDGTKDQVFVSRSFNAQSHFEAATEEVMEMYKRITGKSIDVEKIDENAFQ